MCEKHLWKSDILAKFGINSLYVKIGQKEKVANWFEFEFGMGDSKAWVT